MKRLAPLLLSAIAFTPACQTRESNDPPGFTMSIPDELPKSCRQHLPPRNKGDKPTGETFPASSRDNYESGYREGWKRCFWEWQWNTVDLTQSRPPYELPADPWSSDVWNRGDRDGYEECRKMLVRNGATSNPSVKP